MKFGFDVYSWIFFLLSTMYYVQKSSPFSQDDTPSAPSIRNAPLHVGILFHDLLACSFSTSYMKSK